MQQPKIWLRFTYLLQLGSIHSMYAIFISSENGHAHTSVLTKEWPFWVFNIQHVEKNHNFEIFKSTLQVSSFTHIFSF